MNIDDLNHSKTPTALQEINSKIVAHLDESAHSSQEPDAKSDFSEFKALLVLRDEVIRQHLNTLHSEEKQVFTKLELDVNNMLKEMAQSLLADAKKDITHFVRSRAAVKKYK